MHYKINLKRLFIFFFVFCSVSFLRAEKRALIIAIGNYPQNSGWKQISSDNDVDYIKASLLNRDFSSKNIEIIKNSKATKQGILNAFQSLLYRTKLGDIVYIQYSGHGQRVCDDDNDEIDGVDEAWVPYDSPKKYQKNGYKGERLIRDDEINLWLNKIRAKLGKTGQLIVLMDSCYSGTGIRGQGTARGTDEIMGPAEFIPKPTDGKFGVESEKKMNNMAPLAAFFASGPNELNYEYEDGNTSVGSLTFAFSKIISNVKKPMTMSEVYDRIKLKMVNISNNQHPQFEGDANHYLFKSRSSSDEILFSVHSVKPPKKLIANLGILHNVNVNSKVAIISMNKNKVISNGRVISASLSESEIKLDRSIYPDKNELLKVKVLETTSPPIQSSLTIDKRSVKKWRPIINKLRQQKIFIESKANADLYLKEDKNGRLELRAKDGILICNSKRNKSEFYHVKLFSENIIAFSQSKFLRQHEVKSSEFNLSLDLLPIEVKEQNGSFKEVRVLDKSLFIGKDGMLRFRKGDAAKIIVTNHGTRPAYYSVIDIMPNHQISILIPNPYMDYKTTDFYLPPGESQIIEFPFVFDFPLGKDMLKLIATETPLNLDHILTTRGSRDLDSDSVHPFENLFNLSFQDSSTRGKSTATISSSRLGVSSFIYEIIE